MWSRLIQDCFTFWRRQTPDHPAIVFGDETLTYEDLGRWADGVAAALSTRGIKPGDVVSVVGGNSLQWIAGAMGCGGGADPQADGVGEYRGVGQEDG